MQTTNFNQTQLTNIVESNLPVVLYVMYSSKASKKKKRNSSDYDNEGAGHGLGFFDHASVSTTLLCNTANAGEIVQSGHAIEPMQMPMPVQVQESAKGQETGCIAK